jgi:small GTP-binding protein
MRKLVIGILAHVDAGKTTLAESILYLTGSIRKLGRVDHKDAFLDTYELERARGITIFSKQAVFTHKGMEATLLDTPGHVDFSAEMERTLQVLDYAILVISGSDGVQGHTETLWRLLSRYRIPTFLFVNKMDMEGTDRDTLLDELKRLLNEGCVDFSMDQDQKAFLENAAMCDEALLERYLEHGAVETEDIKKLLLERKIFPCYFGSALRLTGVEDFLNGMDKYTLEPKFPDRFGAKIYKIARDEQGTRLTYLKITGGSLKVKTLLTNRKEAGEAVNRQQEKIIKNQLLSSKPDLRQDDETVIWEEKADQIRIYSGTRYEATEEAQAGTICAVTGLTRTYAGEGLGIEAVSDMPVLEPVLNYRIILPPDCDAHNMLTKLRNLEEEDPQLHIVWSEQLKEIHIQLMGEVQVEILKSIILERFGVSIEFGPGNIVYKETIAEPVVGVGHFEPLRHYAEVHLLLEPNEPGSGLEFATNCSEDVLDRSWQRLILTHLEEKEHVGVLTGSPITDMKITLITGRAHLKHTEGGDFRQATYRAVRQGLKSARSILLEPYYQFRLEIPSDTVGRAMTDIQRMNGSFQPPELSGELSVMTGDAPVATMRGYQAEVTAYTRGRGRLFCSLKGYLPCHNAEEVIQAIGYDSERDMDNPTGSVFCSHGTGFLVDWDKVPAYMHIDSEWQSPEAEKPDMEPLEEPVTIRSRADYRGSLQEDKELEEIFVRTFGPIKQKLAYSQGGLGYEKKAPAGKEQTVPMKSSQGLEQTAPMRFDKATEPVKEYLLVDGYNVIFSWDELNELARANMDAARNKLMDILCNYQGFKKCILILVFDAYKVKGGVGEIFDYHNIHVVYTKEAETADAYIEKVTHEIARKHQVTVATSDALEQLIILGQGAVRLSAKDLKEEIKRIRDQIRREYLDRQPSGRAYLGEQFTDDLFEFLWDENQPERNN